MPRRSAIVVPQPSARLESQYRFWGSRKPPESREPVRAELKVASDGATIATIRLYAPIDSYGGVWGVSAAEFADALDGLDDSVNRIDLHLNSPGGEVYEGIAILNQLRQHPAQTVAIVDSLAASAASVLAVGADETIMAPNSQLMVHDAWGICIGPAGDMQQMGGLLDKVSNNIAAVYQSKAGGTAGDWRAAMLAETWYSADEAVAAGLADSILADDAPAEAEPVAAGFDLSIFKHAGRDDAPAPDLAPAASARDEHAARARHLTLRERRSA